MNFNERVTYKGYLEIWKIYLDGVEELVYNEDNVVCSGMGPVLAGAFSASSTAALPNFQISLFQVGTAGGDLLQVSGTGRLGGALSSLDQYGTGDLETMVHTLVASSIDYENQMFGKIDNAFIDKVGTSKVRWRIILDENACNDLALNEIGIFGFNPGLYATPKSYLCAYRTFNAIDKTSDFILDFRWMLEF